MSEKIETTESAKICFHLLPKVSRTFALGIAGLRGPLRTQVCVSYLLCRILDTIEDAGGLKTSERGELVFPLLGFLREETGADDRWNGLVEDKLSKVSSASDMELMRNTEHVLATFRKMGASERLAVRRWVSEMGRGMVEWSGRMGDGGLKTLKTMDNLDRYCYYIAGTVGYLLTDLFFIRSPHIEMPLFYMLQSRAESFGLGLQKVNIIKDFAEDHERGWCFIPTDLLVVEGLVPDDLVNPSDTQKVYKALLPLLRNTVKHLEEAWEYLSLIPVEEKEVRMFLGESLFFAIETLALVAKDPAELTSKKKLKISRLKVTEVVASLSRFISDPSRLSKYHSKCAEPLQNFFK